MATILFWNLRKRELDFVLAEIILAYDVDILVLAETNRRQGEILAGLNRVGGALYFPARGETQKVAILSRLPEASVKPIGDHPRMTIQNIRPPLGLDFLLVGVHMPDARNYSIHDRHSESLFCARTIVEAETEVGHTRTVVIGDFNMNPYDLGLIDVRGFNAVMDTRIAKDRPRRIRNVVYEYFYNPMWNFLGDAEHGPPGTYFYHSGRTTPHWHMFDQVLLRPSLLDVCTWKDVRVITHVGDRSLLSDTGRINAREFSDHLPLLCRINLEEHSNGK